MSSQKGNTARTRPQKHKNSRAFKNNQNDRTNLIQMLNSLEIFGVCTRCKDQIEWRIKYKKYKPLAAPKKCVKCEQKTVKRAYTTACEPCGSSLQICLKCLQPGELVQKTVLSAAEENKQRQQLEAELGTLPERKRRTAERRIQAEMPIGATNQVTLESSDDSESDSDKEDRLSACCSEQEALDT
ncbi:uncharacterized protein C9orf85 homolog [Watersipora subatra]|uniref:uncharacterized protein C9orf85 homolog n=1 Tax=Watersipora subatra TaxID=2589382 RepID=UPI00355C90E6